MIGYTPTPDYYNDYICHYGTKGMKWGKRKAKTQSNKAHKAKIKTYGNTTLKDKYKATLKKRSDIYDNPNELNTMPINVSKMDERAAERDRIRQEQERKKKKRQKALKTAVDASKFIF